MEHDANCPRCGAQTLPEYKFCLKCGNPLQAAGASPTQVGGMGAKAKARLILVKGEGGDTASYTLGGKEHICGRTQGIVLFPDDETVSPVHAVFFYRDGDLYVQDKNSLNGTYVRIRDEIEMTDGDTFIVGEQVLVYGEGIGKAPAERDKAGTLFLCSPCLDDYFSLTQLLAGGKPGQSIKARKPQLAIGREQADLSFPDDRFMSHRHAMVEKRTGKAFLRDSQSRNGTFFKLRAGTEYHLSDGDFVFIGRQLLKVAF